MSDLSDVVEKMGIKCLAIYQGTPRVSNDNRNKNSKLYMHDKWEVKLSFEERYEFFNYSTGLGYRKLSPFCKKHNGIYETPSGNFIYTEQVAEAGYLLPDPKNIKAADIIHSLMLDVQSGSETFEDYCSNFGLSEDSREALDIYLKCQKNGSKLKRFLLGSYSDLEGLDH